MLLTILLTCILALNSPRETSGFVSPLGKLTRTAAHQRCLHARVEGPSNALEDAFTRVKMPLLSLALISALALPVQAFDPSVFTNDYEDPFHPMCRRHIEVAADGATFHYSGTAVGPKDDPVRRGCSPAEIKEFKIRRGAFDGVVLPGNKISAGDGIHEGIWEPAGTATTSLGYEDVDGIRWNDGNKWIVKKKSNALRAGEGLFYSYIGFSTLAGVKGVYDGIQRKRQAQ